MKEKVVDLDVDGKTHRFVLRSLTYGQRNECLRKSTRMNAMLKTAEVDPFLFNELRVAESIQAPPEFKSLDKVRSLDPELGDKLIVMIDELNGTGNLGSDSSEKA